MNKLDLSLYVITASIPELGRDHVDVAEAAIKGGATVIQMRIKRRPMNEALKIAKEIHEMSSEAGIPLIINDHVGIAMASKAEGLHTGPHDISITSAMRMLGSGVVIGRSIKGKPADAIGAEKEGAGYVAVGPVYPTETKKTETKEVGPNTIAKVKAVVNVPVVAIGGINPGNLGACIEAGADGIAVISYVSKADDMVAATAELKKEIEAARERRNTKSKVS